MNTGVRHVGAVFRGGGPLPAVTSSAFLELSDRSPAGRGGAAVCVRPIPARVRVAMEGLFGHDFSNVRLVVDASRLPTGVRAFARGNDIYMDARDAALDHQDSWQVLGHELAHVVQQRHGRTDQHEPEASGGWRIVHVEELEQEADRFGSRAVLAMRGEIEAVRPLLTSPVAVGRPVVQCIMSLENFQEQTKSMTPRIVDRVSVIDDEIKKFHKLDAAKPRKYVDLFKQIKVLQAAAHKFLSDKANSPRRDGVSALSRQVYMEGAVLELLSQYEEETDDVDKFKFLEKAQEFFVRNIGRPELARRDLSNELTTLINQHANLMRGAGGRDSALVLRDIEKLKKLALDPTLPGILKSVVLEATASSNVQKIDTAVMTPGLKYNTTRGGGASKYTLNHFMGQHFGRRFRMGSLLHELTHLSNAEIFDHTCLMLSIRKTATDADMLSLAARRRGALLSLKTDIEGATGLNADLKNELISKVGYPIGGKFASYLLTFKPKLDAATHGRLSTLQKSGLDCELIEYDSVVNQMFMWCHLFAVDPASGVYTKLRSMVEDAYRYRQSERLMAKPLPVPPVRAAAGMASPVGPAAARTASTPPRKPLPLVPVRR